MESTKGEEESGKKMFITMENRICFYYLLYIYIRLDVGPFSIAAKSIEMKQLLAMPIKNRADVRVLFMQEIISGRICFVCFLFLFCRYLS